MAKSFNLSIITPDKIAYEGKAVSLVVPAALGYLGVLADHRPLVSNIVNGKITLTEGSGKMLTFHCKSKGFLEVLKNNVTIILNQDE
jgi:F-type H+-transporting ATPase subunit epsilon